MINTATVCSLRHSEICCVLTIHKRQIVVMTRQSDLSFQLLPLSVADEENGNDLTFVKQETRRKRKKKIYIGEILMCY